MNRIRRIAAFLIISFFAIHILPGFGANFAASSNVLVTHWVPRWGYRDELNASDIDHQNFWTDNAGKILATAELTNDTLDANRALAFLEQNGLGASDYLPEALVNSTMQTFGNEGITNKIAILQATNLSSSDLEQVSLGSYYPGIQTLGYLGSDRLLIGGIIHSSVNSTVYETASGFVKRSEFVTSDGNFYTYLNATLSPGRAFANVSLQILPLTTGVNSSDLLYLQVFSSAGQFDNASLYGSNGGYVRSLAYDNGSPSAQNGTIITYSRKDSTLTQDSVAISFGNSNSTVDDFEHWYLDGAFNGLSWIGIAYNAPSDAAGKLSSPILTKVYPIDHMDTRLINDTAKYIAPGTRNTTVSPPVSFGFIAYGLALASHLNEGNLTLRALAENYWNYYYSAYESPPIDYSTPYGRAINVFALAGFTLYGCNSTVENFTRNFLGNTSGSAIEEYGWGVAALYRLETCTNSQSDISLYDSFLNSFGTSKSNFVIRSSSLSSDLNPSSTFQFGEAASGLLLGGIPYNDPVVLEAMNAVYQSNISGTLLNQPYHGDLANTETIPAILLSTFLFQTEMANRSGYWITGLQRVNVTSIDYVNGTLLLSATGSSGSLQISNGININSYAVNGNDVIEVQNFTLINTSSTATFTSTTTSSSTSPTVMTAVNSCPGCVSPQWAYIMSAIIAILLVSLGFVLFRRKSKTL